MSHKSLAFKELRIFGVPEVNPLRDGKAKDVIINLFMKGDGIVLVQAHEAQNVLLLAEKRKMGNDFRNKNYTEVN